MRSALLVLTIFSQTSKMEHHKFTLQPSEKAGKWHRNKEFSYLASSQTQP